MKFQRAVFCEFDERPRVAERRKGTREFDGTITTEDTFVRILEKFAPVVSAKLLPIIFDRKVSLKEGIKQTIGSISSVHYPEIIEYIAHRPIHSGLTEFADFLNDLDVPLVVISGGLTDIVKAVLEEQGLINKVTGIHAAEVDTTGNLLQVYSSFEGDTELVAKVKAMAQYPTEEKIAIGDSVTDINMALAADLVFARDCALKEAETVGSPDHVPRRDTSTHKASRRHRLVGYLDAENKSYVQWQDFFDIRDCEASRPKGYRFA